MRPCARHGSAREGKSSQVALDPRQAELPGQPGFVTHAPSALAPGLLPTLRRCCTDAGAVARVQREQNICRNEVFPFASCSAMLQSGSLCGILQASPTLQRICSTTVPQGRVHGDEAVIGRSATFMRLLCDTRAAGGLLTLDDSAIQWCRSTQRVHSAPRKTCLQMSPVPHAVAAPRPCRAGHCDLLWHARHVPPNSPGVPWR
jgi:hypothetical protein